MTFVTDDLYLNSYVYKFCVSLVHNKIIKTLKKDLEGAKKEAESAKSEAKSAKEKAEEAEKKAGEKTKNDPSTLYFPYPPPPMSMPPPCPYLPHSNPNTCYYL
ncbi:putative major outer membrane lipoprotein Oprl [Helianthus anomalus]